MDHMQSQRSLSIENNRLPTVLLIATLAAALLLVPQGVSAASSVTSITATNSSAVCYYAFSIHSLLNSFSCGLKTTSGTVIVVFLGCLSGTSTACDNASVVDTENNVYTYVGDSEASCDGSTCEEYAFLATTSSTRNDTLTFATAGSAYLGGDVYDVLGINASNFLVGSGGSSMNRYPTLTDGFADTEGNFVAAGVIANDALQFNYIPYSTV